MTTLSPYVILLRPMSAVNASVRSWGPLPNITRLCAEDRQVGAWVAQIGLQRGVGRDKYGLRARSIRETRHVANVKTGVRFPVGALEFVMNETMMTNVAYLGPEGSFSHIAAFLHVESWDEEPGGLLKPMKSIREVFEAVENGSCRWGIVPYENSLAGNIAETLEGFHTPQVAICGEIYVPVNHVLMTAAVDASEIENIYSKYEVFGQCHKWLSANMPNVEQVPVASTAHAARLASEDANGAAIGSVLAAKHFKMDVLHYNLSGSTDNFTRFLVIASRDDLNPDYTGNDKTTMRFEVPHEPGALVDVLKIFCVRNVNLTHLALVPESLSPLSRVFFVDFSGHVSQHTDLIYGLQEAGLLFTIVGSYPRAEDLL